MTEVQSPRASASTFREAVRLAWPATMSLLLHACYRVNDQFWVQDLGSTAQAALGVTSFMLIFNFAFVSVVYTGTLARTARASGAGNRQALETSHHTAIKFGTLWLLLIGALGYLSTDFWVAEVGATGETAGMASEYLSVLYLVYPFIGMKPVVDSIFIGMGNTLVPMVLSGAAVGLNFILNPILIYGWGPAPELGIAGAAWATGISRALGALAGYFILARYYHLKMNWLKRIRWEEVFTMVRISLPMAVSIGAYAYFFIRVLEDTIKPFGHIVQAGLGIGFNGVEAISYCGLMGPATAVASMVGRRLGAGDRVGARQAVRSCMVLSVGFATVTSLVFLLMPEPVVRVYSSDPAVIEQAVLYLWIVAWSQTATAAQAVLEQTMAGAGYTLWMAVFNVIGNGVRVPLAWLFAIHLGYGPAGAWWAMNLTNVTKLAAIFLIYRNGRWLTAHSTPPKKPPMETPAGESE